MSSTITHDKCDKLSKNELLLRIAAMKSLMFKGLSPDWVKFLDNSKLDVTISHLIFKNINSIPVIDNVFEFARLTPLNKIKVIILGQRPRSKIGYSHGLSFSCQIGVTPSIQSIYKCLVHSKLVDKLATDGNLTYWATQGVLLLNCALTTISNNTHRQYEKLWYAYTDDLISRLSRHISTFKIKNKANISEDIKKYPIFMLWGSTIKKKDTLLDNKCTVLKWCNPIPQLGQSFTECDHFIIANKKLINVGCIDWNQCPQKGEVECRFGMTDRKTVVFTDGSCYPNKTCKEGLGGYAASFVLGKFKDVVLYGNCSNDIHYATNQRAEGEAIYRTLMYLDKHLTEWDECIIVSDTEFWIKMFTQYMFNWDVKCMDFKEKKNPDMTVPMWDLYKKLCYTFEKVIEFRHVKSHNKDKWKSFPEESYEYFCWFNNDYVDEMAGYARQSVKPSNHIVEDVEY
jgi:uracil-DNA glycosylase